MKKGHDDDGDNDDGGDIDSSVEFGEVVKQIDPTTTSPANSIGTVRTAIVAVPASSLWEALFNEVDTIDCKVGTNSMMSTNITHAIDHSMFSS